MSTTTTETKPSGETLKVFEVCYHLANSLHVKSYPAVNEGVETYNSYEIGRKSANLASAGYERFVSPFIPYAKGPYQYVAPIVSKVDHLGDKGLSRVDTTFPIITKDTDTIKATILDFAYFPFRVVGDGKNYLFDTYGSEYKKCGGESAPYTSSGKAVITTGLVVTQDVLNWASELFAKKKAQGQTYANEKYKQSSDYAKTQYEYANGKKDEALNYASDKAEQARNLAYAQKEEAEKKASEAKKTAEKKASK
ncbi:uncharacterized protein KY384_007214 [Bacidia gigantensis]|uniref:uncharacterized protein n=1 Tax=Bacidia gigantensis TaxID=2732470 RepID=UPI001D04DD79|nr:uncharacterized protein KY384_007214 [Bacidia gigantensis]KAG8528297.1 hypothetical protein KY384_007214 [Bacidia gigantensis]